MQRLIIFIFLLPLLGILGCSGGGGASGPSQTSEGTAQESNQKVDIIINLEHILSSGVARSTSRIRKSLFPNLGSLRLEISAEGLETLVLNFSPTASNASAKLSVGFRYTIRVIALNSSGEIIAEGTANLDLLVQPQQGQTPEVKVILETVNPSNIQAKTWPGSGNILPGQPIYIYLNQPGRLHYAFNGGSFEAIDDVPSTAGQRTTAENGMKIQPPGQAGETVSLRFLGEDEEGRTGEIQAAQFQIVLPTTFQAIDVAVVRSTRMTSADFSVSQIIPVNRETSTNVSISPVNSTP
jgi:hypothetical protein